MSVKPSSPLVIDLALQPNHKVLYRRLGWHLHAVSPVGLATRTVVKFHIPVLAALFKTLLYYKKFGEIGVNFRLIIVKT